MAASERELRGIAESLIRESAEDSEYSLVYEAEDLDWLTEEEQKSVHHLMQTAYITAEWED